MGPILVDKAQAAEKIDTGFPRGWRFYKQFVHKDGRVFERGVENKNLKDTIESTVIEVKPKLSRYEKDMKNMDRDFCLILDEKKILKKENTKIKNSIEMFFKLNETVIKEF
jgi:hypothetical protein